MLRKISLTYLLIKISIALFTILTTIVLLLLPLYNTKVFASNNEQNFDLENNIQDDQRENINCNDLRLNEIMPNPKGTDTGNEWLELFNCLEEEIDLSNYKLQDKSGNEETLSGFLEAKEFIVIFTQISLNQINEEIKLLTIDDQIIDEFSYEQSQEDVSFSRIINGTGEWTDELPPTPGESNEVNYNHNLRINEIYPTPKEGEEEFLELFNFSEESIDLSNWSISDKNETIYLDQISINPNSYLVLTEDELNGVTLNNSGDEISLIDPTGYIVDNLEYEKTSKGISNIIDEDGILKQSLLATPNQKNQFIDPNDCFYKASEISIKDFQNIDDNSNKYIISGKIISNLSEIYKNRLYVEDETGGIQLSIPENFDFNYKTNDLIKICGTKSSYYKENTLKAVDIKPDFYDFKIRTNTSIDFIEHIGELSNYTGTIAKKTSSYMIITIKDSDINLKINKTKNFSFRNLTKGDLINLTGILSIRGFNEDNEPNIRLIVTNANSIKILERFKKIIKKRHKRRKNKKYSKNKGYKNLEIKHSVIKRPKILKPPTYSHNDKIFSKTPIKQTKKLNKKGQTYKESYKLLSGISFSTSLSSIVILLKKSSKDIA